MAPIPLSEIVSALPSDETWGPDTSTENTLDGVPYAPYSKGDKLGRMADWTSEGKDGRDGRGGRQQYNRNYRGTHPSTMNVSSFANSFRQISKSTALELPACSPSKSLKMNPLSPLSIIPGHLRRLVVLDEEEERSSVVVASEAFKPSEAAEEDFRE
jgi:hypothetical protein